MTYWDDIASRFHHIKDIHKESADASSGDKKMFHLAMAAYHQARTAYGAAMLEHEKALKDFQEKEGKGDDNGAQASHALASQHYAKAQQLIQEMRDAQKQAKTLADKNSKTEDFARFPEGVGGPRPPRDRKHSHGGGPRGHFGPLPWEKEWPENVTFHEWEATKLTERIQKLKNSTGNFQEKGNLIESLEHEKKEKEAANAYDKALQQHYAAHKEGKEDAKHHLEQAQGHRAQMEEHHKRVEEKRPKHGPGCGGRGPWHRHHK
jgi:tetratricopeptide (TPR) repeat protein